MVLTLVSLHPHIGGFDNKLLNGLVYSQHCSVHYNITDLMSFTVLFMDRRCAREALRDVVKYLNMGEGQVAVSETCCLVGLHAYVHWY